ncbi:MAG: hypothetical protein AAGA68_08445 [Pseudomonadota bacterium]
MSEILRLRDPAARLAALRASDHPQAQFLWALHRDLFHYCAYHLGDIADGARQLDFAIRWGYGWKLGPFELWQAAGWRQVSEWIREDIAAGKALCNAPLCFSANLSPQIKWWRKPTPSACGPSMMRC